LSREPFRDKLGGVPAGSSLEGVIHMSRTIVNAALREKLSGLMKVVELCDESGRVLGRSLPRLDPAHYEELEPQISKEELRRSRQSKERTYTTAEVLAYLEKI
jgi:hypothetical protein